MIVRKFYKRRSDGVRLYRTYSDANVYIKKIGTDEVYSNAVDVDGASFVYEETDIPIPVKKKEGEAVEATDVQE